MAILGERGKGGREEEKGKGRIGCVSSGRKEFGEERRERERREVLAQHF